MSAPSYAQFYRNHEDGDIHIGSIFINCGWYFHEAEFLNGVACDLSATRYNGDLVPGTEWDYFIAYGTKYTKEELQPYADRYK